MQDQGRECRRTVARGNEHVEGVDEQARRAAGSIEEILPDSHGTGAGGQRLSQYEVCGRRTITYALHAVARVLEPLRSSTPVHFLSPCMSNRMHMMGVTGQQG